MLCRGRNGLADAQSVGPHPPSSAYCWDVADERIVTAAEFERMTPDERRRLLNERVLTDLSQVEAEFLVVVRAKGRALHAERRANDASHW